MNNSLSTIIDDLFGSNVYRGLSDQYNNSSKPSVNITETPDQYKMEFSVPGLKKEDIKIDIEDKNLIVSYDHTEEKSEDGEKFLRREFSHKSFSRNFSLGNSINVNDIAAKFENGILTLTLPKKEEVKPIKKQIEIA